METVIFCLDVLMPIMHGDDHVRPDAVDARVKRVHLALNFRDHGALGFLPPSIGSFPAHIMNPVVRVLSIGLVDAANLQIHFSHSPMDHPATTASRGAANLRIRRYAD